MGTNAPEGPRPDLRDKPLPELLKEFAESITSLMQNEIELAKAEVTRSVKTMGQGAAAFAGAAVFALAALGALTATLILALGAVMPDAIAALIVTILWVVVAAIAAVIGRGMLQKASPPVPEKAQAGLHEDVQAIKEGVVSGADGNPPYDTSR